jgi:SAM-dependent methyltransferase
LSEADLRKWDARYRDGSYSERRHPTALLARYLDQLRRGTALDIACGAGRNALALAASGFDVDAVDISTAGLDRLRADARAQGLEVNALEGDLEHGYSATLAIKDCYDLIVMVRYVNQALIEPTIDRLADGGVLICEQHLRTDQDVVGPSSEAFRLGPNELLSSVRELRVHHYFEGIVIDPDGRRAALAQLVASRGGTDLIAG